MVVSGEPLLIGRPCENGLVAVDDSEGPRIRKAVTAHDEEWHVERQRARGMRIWLESQFLYSFRCVRRSCA